MSFSLLFTKKKEALFKFSAYTSAVLHSENLELDHFNILHLFVCCVVVIYEDVNLMTKPLTILFF